MNEDNNTISGITPESLNGSKRQIVLPDADSQLIMKVDTNIKLGSVILSINNKKRITSFLEELSYKSKLRAEGLEPMNRLLFYGDSGCGKTYLSKALSNHLGYPMLYIDIAAALSKGKAAENLAKVFTLAKDKEAIIFLDECDSIAWSRDQDSNDTGDIRRATNSLFQLMDQMSDDTIMISATNMLHRLDPAFERRFDLKLKFTNPINNLTEVLTKFLYSRFILEDDVDEDRQKIMNKRTSVSYYELQHIAERAMKAAVIKDNTKLYSVKGQPVKFYYIKLSEVYQDLSDIVGLKQELGTSNQPEKE